MKAKVKAEEKKSSSAPKEESKDKDALFIKEGK